MRALARDGRERGLRFMLALTALVLIASWIVGVSNARAAVYKWVDEKGVTHYTDKMPPDAVERGNVELNKEGVQIKRTDRALTPEQRKAIAQEEERQRALARQQEEVARRDRALLSSYTSEAEIDLARNRSLQTINSVIASTQAFSEQLSKRKQEAEAKRSESQGKPSAATIDRELESIDAELARQSEIIAQKKRESVVIIAKYDADKQRWRELIASKTLTEPRQESQKPDPKAQTVSVPSGTSSPSGTKK